MRKNLQKHGNTGKGEDTHTSSLLGSSTMECSNWGSGVTSSSGRPSGSGSHWRWGLSWGSTAGGWDNGVGAVAAAGDSNWCAPGAPSLSAAGDSSWLAGSGGRPGTPGLSGLAGSNNGLGSSSGGGAPARPVVSLVVGPLSRGGGGRGSLG